MSAAFIRSALNGLYGIIGFGATEAVKFDSTGILEGYAPGSVTPAALSQKLTLGTAIATTSGTSIDITGIPSWVKKITLAVLGVSTNGSSPVRLVLGTPSGMETSGYLGSCDSISTTGGATVLSTAFDFERAGGIGPSVLRHGSVELTLAGNNVWTTTSILGFSNGGEISYMGGSKALSGVLDRLRLTTANGTDIFDAGSVTVLYE